MSKKLRKELEKIDQSIEQLTKEQQDLQNLLLKNSDVTGIAQASKRLKAIETDLIALEEKWLSLSEEIEAIES